jgi:hypothetical protein
MRFLQGRCSHTPRARSKQLAPGAEKAYKISASYIAAVKLFLSGVKDAHVKKALDDAQSVLAYHIAGELKQVVDGKK